MKGSEFLRMAAKAITSTYPGHPQLGDNKQSAPKPPTDSLFSSHFPLPHTVHNSAIAQPNPATALSPYMFSPLEGKGNTSGSSIPLSDLLTGIEIPEPGLNAEDITHLTSSLHEFLSEVVSTKTFRKPGTDETPPPPQPGELIDIANCLSDAFSYFSQKFGSEIPEETTLHEQLFDSIPTDPQEIAHNITATITELEKLFASLKNDQENPQEDRKEDLIRLTRQLNSLATYCSFIGFLASGTQGALRIALPAAEVPAFANALLMPIARSFYNAGSFTRSYLREETTIPENRTNPEARATAKLSNVMSTGSMVHGALVGAAILMKQSFVDSLPTASRASVALRCLRIPGFNMTGLLGILGAILYNISEKTETDELIARDAKALKGRVPPSIAHLVSDDELEKIVRGAAPHLTSDEYFAKNAAFLACAVAAVGGLGGAVPILASRFTQLITVLGKDNISKIADMGGRANGVFYATWPLFVMLTHESYNSEERRLPEHLENMWSNLRKQAAMESAGILALTVGALVTFYKAKNGSKLKNVADIILNKMDVIAGTAAGATFIGAAALKEKTPSAHEQLTTVLTDADGTLRRNLELTEENKGMLLDMLEAKDSPNRKILLDLLQTPDSPFAKALEDMPPALQEKLQEMLQNTETPFSTMLKKEVPSFQEQFTDLFENNPLLLSGFFARSVWLGPRMGILSSIGDYLERTNPYKYTLEERTEYVRDVAQKLPKKAQIPHAKTLAYDELRSILEHGTYEKDDPNNEMASKGISNKRPICPAAYYAGQMLAKVEEKATAHRREIEANAKANALRKQYRMSKSPIPTQIPSYKVSPQDFKISPITYGANYKGQVGRTDALFTNTSGVQSHRR